MDKVDMVCGVLEDDWLSTNQIRHKAGLCYYAVFKILKKLQSEDKIDFIKLKNARYWKKKECEKNADI